MDFGEVSATVKGTYQVEAPPCPKCPLTIARLIDVELSQQPANPSTTMIVKAGGGDRRCAKGARLSGH